MQAPRSTFVTVLAWIFIVLSGFATFISVLQNLIVQLLFNSQDFDKAIHSQTHIGAPPVSIFMLNHFRLFFAVFMVMSVIMLVVSIGLLLRKNWARLAFIGLMILGIIWNLASLVIQYLTIHSMGKTFSTMPNAPDMKSFFIVMAIFSLIFALGFSILYGWIAKRLLSTAIAAEFKSKNSASAELNTQ